MSDMNLLFSVKGHKLLFDQLHWSMLFVSDTQCSILNRFCYTCLVLDYISTAVINGNMLLHVHLFTNHNRYFNDFSVSSSIFLILWRGSSYCNIYTFVIGYLGNFIFFPLVIMLSHSHHELPRMGLK